jgi:integrase
MRHSQVGRLTREDIWLDHDPPLVIVNQPGKDGNPHWKPLTAEAVEAFRMFIEKDALGEFSASSVYKSWKLACDEAGVPFFNPYRLRHTYATTLRAGGMDLADVQELVGHTSSKTTARYAMVSAPKLMTARTTLDTAWDRARTNVENAWQTRVADNATDRKTTV